MAQAVKASPSRATQWEVDEGVRSLAPVQRADGRVAVAGGLFAAGSTALAYVGSDPALLGPAGVGVATAALAAVSHRRGKHRDELRDQLAEQLCPVMGLPSPSRKAVLMSGWSEGFTGHPSKIVLIYAARLIPDPVWTGKVIAVVESCLGGTYRVAKANERRHRLELERYVQEQAPAEEQAVARTRQVVEELLGDSAQVQVDVDDQGQPHRIQVHHQQGNLMAIPNRRQRVQRILATRVPGEWQAAWNLQEDRVEFFIRQPMPTLLFPPEEHSLSSVSHEAYMDFEVPLGVDEDDEVLTWFPRKQAHLLVIGQSGSGKTVVQHNVVQRLTQAGWRTWILDGKRIEFLGFRSWPNVELVASRLEHQVKMIVDAHALMMDRYEQIENGSATLADFEPLALVVDEATTFLKGADRWWKQVKPKGAPAKAPVLDLMADMARLARSAKIHILLGLQRPDVEFIGGEMRDNFGARVAMGRLSPQGAMMMWDSAAIGTAVPRHIKGRGTALNASGVPVAVQTYLAQNPFPDAPGYDAEATEAVRPKELLYPRKQVEVLEPVQDDIDGNPVPLGYDDYMAAKVYESEEQPTVGGTPGTKGTKSTDAAAVSGSALGALQGLTGSRPKPASPQTPNHRTEGPVEPPVPEADPVDLREDDLDFEGFEDHPDEVGVLELNAGDLVLIDPEASRWAVVTEDPEPDAEDEVLLDLVDWQSGAPEATSLPATEMIQTRRVLQEA